ncbi:restriction endonuclease subunit S [Sulfurimonas sp.]|uniref:restriction endonuclease subunit S n=1 Tax=Sulfurimonas sp. TaxID=2022749 RepID=UPI0025E799D3|nr:restriction endonuclease subunit S [Sulfurimonas sp.]
MKHLPQGWKIEKLGDLGKVLTGKTPSKAIPEFWDSQDIPFYKPDDFSKNDITDLYDGKDYISNTAFVKAVKVPPNTVLTTCIGIIGKVAITKKECSFNQQINAVIPDERISYKFLAYSIIRLKGILQQQANAAVVPMINKSEFSKTPITFPPIPQQEKIVSVLDTASALVEKQKALLKKYDLFLKSKFIEMFGDPILNPMGWEVVKFGNLISFLTDYHANGSYEILKKNVELLDKRDYALMVRTTDLEHNDFENGVKYISEHAYNYLTKSKVYGNEIIMNKIGSAGSVYLMPKLNRAVSLGMNLFLIRLEDTANPTFMYWILTSEYGKQNIEKKVRGAVTKSITKDAVRDIDLMYPPVELQNQFAQIVEQTETLKQKEQLKLEKLQTLYDALMKQAFDGEIQ